MNFIKAMTNKLLKPFGYYGYSGYKFYDTDYQNFIREAYDNPIIFACFKEVINDFNAAEICVYREVGDKVEKIPQHEVQKLLDNPNPSLTKSDFQEYYNSWLLLGGGLLMEKTSATMISNKNINLYPTDSFEIKRDGKGNVSGIKVGGTQIEGSNLKRYRIAKSINVDDIVAGYGEEFRSPLKSAAKPTDMSNFAFNHMNSQLANSGKRTGIMEYKKMMSKEKLEEGKRNFDAMGSGVDGAGRTAWLNGENFNFIPLDLTPQELDWINSMQLVRELICGCIGVPVSLISSTNSTYNNITEYKKKIYQDTIIPMLKNYCENMTKFLKDELGEGYYIWYDVSEIKALEVDNTDAVVKITGALSGVATINEVRKVLSDKYGFNLEEVNDPGYNTIFVQQTLIPVGDAVEVVEPVEGGVK